LLVIALILFILICLLAIAMPVAFAMALAGIAGLYAQGGAGMVAGILTTVPVTAVSDYELITVPMFMLMAELVLASGIAEDLFKAAAAWVGRVPGGLAMATALAGAGFGTICGSSTASAATLSSTSLPAMLRHGYEPSLAGGVVAISGTLAILLPTSVAMVVYGLLADVNIGKLLISGVIPSILITFIIIATIGFLVWKNPESAPISESASWNERLRLVGAVAPMLVILLAITGALFSGLATPTEASAVGAAAAFILAVTKKNVSSGMIITAFQRAAVSSCMIFMILMGASIFSYAVTLTQVVQDLLAFVGSLHTSRWLILIAILAGYLVLGSFMDQLAILVLTVPIVLPVIRSLGFDPIWFGVIKMVTAEVGLITPPIGLNCYVVARYSQRPVSEIFRGTFPHFIAHLIAIAILVAFPAITLWLPSLM
jgi:tripartite ATP-independent transporter DctM subunit